MILFLPHLVILFSAILPATISNNVLVVQQKFQSGPAINGRLSDAATGLVHVRLCYLDPSLGRFTQRDPLLYIDGMNLYEAFGSNPIKNVDPTGMVIEEAMNYFLYQPGVYASNDEIQTVMSMGLEPSEASGGELRMLRNAGQALFGFTPTGAAMGYTVNPVNVAVESGRVVGGAYTGAVEGTTQSLVNFKAAQLIAGRETNLVEEAAYGTLHNLGLLGLAEGPANVDLQSNATLSDQPVDFLFFSGNEQFRRTTEGIGMAAILLSGFAPEQELTTLAANTQRAAVRFWADETGSLVFKSIPYNSKQIGAIRLEANALMKQGFTRKESFDLMRQFKAGVNPNNEFAFHFTSLEGGKGILSEGIIRSGFGLRGKGVYAGTTPTPSFFIKHTPGIGYGLINAPVRIPIYLRDDMILSKYLLPVKTLRINTPNGVELFPLNRMR